jgi:hypothetical protein
MEVKSYGSFKIVVARFRWWCYKYSRWDICLRRDWLTNLERNQVFEDRSNISCLIRKDKEPLLEICQVLGNGLDTKGDIRADPST